MCSEAGAINDCLSMKSVKKKILEKLNNRFPESEAIKILICDHRLRARSHIRCAGLRWAGLRCAALRWAALR